MEIQKIFSDMYDEERIYSVLMNEDEIALFSEIQKEFNSKAQKALRKKFDTEVGKSFHPKASKSEALRSGRKILQDKDYHSGVHRDVTGKIVGNGSDKYYGNGIDDLISRRGCGERLTTNKTAIGKKAESQLYRASRMKPGSPEQMVMFKKAEENMLKHYKELNTPKSVKTLKKLGKIALGTAAGVGLVYGGKKLYNHYKNNNKED